MLVGDMGIYLRGRYIAMPKHTLDRAKVGAVHEQIGRERVTERVRADVFGDTSELGVVLHETLNRSWGYTEAFTLIVASFKTTVSDK